MPSTISPAAQAIERIARTYDLELRERLPVSRGYRNESHPILLHNGSIANVMLYKDEPGIAHTIRRANCVGDFLAAHGFPARRTLDVRLLKVRAGTTTKYAAIYNHLPGETIAWEAYTQRHIKLLGGSLSDMHAALRNFDTTDLPDVAEVYLRIVGRMRHYFADMGVQKALAKKLNLSPPKLDDFADLLRASVYLPNQQGLHMDFVRGNILFSSVPEITGILDFEKVARGHRLFDIARTLAFLLVDCKYKPADKVRKYFLQSGYRKRGAIALPKVTIKLPEGNTDFLEALIDLFLTYDFYKFLCHNPYESLPTNEHFVRTCDMLTSRRKWKSGMN